MARGMGLYLGRSDSLSQPRSELISPEAHGCIGLGKHSSFKEEERNGCQVVRADFVVCEDREKCREVNLFSPRLLPQPKGLSLCTGSRAGESHPPPFLSMSHKHPVALLAQGRMATTLLHPKRLQCTCPNLTLATPTSKLH